MNGAQLTLKSFLPSSNYQSPQFSKDDSHIFYLDECSGLSQIFSINVETGDRRQITHWVSPIKQFVCSPKTNQLIFSADNDGDEQYQLYVFDTEIHEVRRLTTSNSARHNAGTWSSDGLYFSYASNERNGIDFDVYVLTVSTGNRRRVYTGTGWCSPAGFSPRGTYLAVFLIHSNDNSDIYLCHLNSGIVDHVNPHSGATQNGPLRWAPSETFFYFTTDQGCEFKSLARYVIEKRSIEIIISSTWDIDRTAISNDGRYLAMVTNEDGYHKLTLLEAGTLTSVPFEFPTGEITSLAFSRSASQIAVAHNSSTIPSQITIMNVTNNTSITLATAQTPAPRAVLVEPELVRIASFDGLTVPTLVYRPRSANRQPTAPVLIYIHGGPEAQYRPTYNPATQYLVSLGYIVAAPNIRGSSGYGKSYLALDNLEKRPNAIRDVIALRHHLAVQCGRGTSFILMGASYGGYVVLSCLAHFPSLWAAGVNLMGITNFETFLANTAPYRRRLREAEYGSLNSHKDLLKQLSPINFADEITAPLFVAHGARDVQVPITEAQQLIATLRSASKRVDYRFYDNEGHGFLRLENRIDVYNRINLFISSVIGGTNNRA